MPADGVKGKTWGPSTLHQRERCAIIPTVCSPTSPHPGIGSIEGVDSTSTTTVKRWSRSAPDLEKAPVRTNLPGHHHRSHHHHHHHHQHHNHHHKPQHLEIGKVRKRDSKKLYSSVSDLIDSPPREAADEEEDEENDEDDDDSSSSSFVVGCVRRTKRRERSKSKDSSYVISDKSSSKRRGSSETRKPSLADFFRSPSSSRKSSLNNERKNSSTTVTIKINDSSESSPENSVAHKSRISKSPLRFFGTWGSRDTLDEKSANKVEYSVLHDSVTLPKLDSKSSTPSFLAANSREGIDFENLESELTRNLESDQSTDDGKFIQELDLTKANEKPHNFSDNSYVSNDDTEDLIDTDDRRAKIDDNKNIRVRENHQKNSPRRASSDDTNHQKSVITTYANSRIHVAKNFFRRNYAETVKKN